MKPVALGSSGLFSLSEVQIYLERTPFRPFDEEGKIDEYVFAIPKVEGWKVQGSKVGRDVGGSVLLGKTTTLKVRNLNKLQV